jgi:hypothetical protein
MAAPRVIRYVTSNNPVIASMTTVTWLMMMSGRKLRITAVMTAVVGIPVRGEILVRLAPPGR